MSVRGLLSCLAFILLFQLIGQPELDDRQPLVGSRALSAKIFKQVHSTKIDLTQVQPFALTLAGHSFTPEFYLTFVRITEAQDGVRMLRASRHSGRSPPSLAAF